ncbi:MAG: T9SS type A sorting domain-containing protein [Flavobacteriaceae bacterium]|nr:T9SS type A sorting domain-containing protein [Flavobacteriaceae bacterium]
MKHFTILGLFFISLLGYSQNFEDEWTGLFSYASVKAISHGNDQVFAGTENAVFSYDLISQELITISTVNGLSGESISSIYYSEGFGLLVIGYENGLIDIKIDNDDDILKVVDILEEPTIPPDRKRINGFYEYNGNLYISTEFGISVYDLSRLEFGDTYFIGDLGALLNITQTTVLEPYIYASSLGGGLRRAMVEDDNLIDFEQWEALSPGVINLKGVVTLGSEIFVARNDNIIARLQGSSLVGVSNINQKIVDFNSEDDILTITTDKAIQAYTPGFNLTASVTFLPNFDFVLQSGISLNGSFYMGTKELGMLAVPYNTTTANQLLPEGPLLNQPFSLDTSAGQLWVSYGDVSQTFDPFPLDFLGVSNLKEEEWINLTPDTPFLSGASDLVEVKINPFNPSEVYISSFQKGLLRITEQVPDKLFDETNSTLERVFIDGDDAGIRIFGSEFDRDGNLWFVQSKINDGLIKLSISGQIQKFNFEALIDGEKESALTHLTISREGFVFFGTQKNGMLGYNPTTNSFNRITETTGNGNLPSTQVRSLAFDNQNRLWIGTARGLRVLFNVAGFFEEGANVEAQSIIIEEDGVGQELLVGQTITDIEVDGSNNKWVATSSSGVFYFSPNGQETLLRFNKDNSPLPSNNVQDIAIDELSGRVYFATVNGLVAFDGTSTAPRDDLENVYAFPNPVRPGFTGNVTIDGLTANANVKITDIEGNLVFETTSEGGSVLWDTSAFGQYKVASGVYMILITTDDALETKVSKIMIVR